MKVRVDQKKWIETEQLISLGHQLSGYIGRHLYRSRKGTYIVRTINPITGESSYRLATNEEVQRYLDSIQFDFLDTDEI